MMKGRMWAVWLVAIFLLPLMLVPVQGHEIPDVNHIGSISLTIKDGDVPLAGGTLELYRVGDIVESDGDYSFALAADYQQREVSLEDIQSAETAKKLAQWLENQAVQKISVQIDEQGQAKFVDLKPGLYLIIQDKASEGYMPVDPFLVSLPMYDGSHYIYDVEATPKISEVETAPTEPDSTKPPQIKDPELPQTGQNNWPVPVMACIGISLVLLGAFLCRGRRKDT